MTREEKKRVIYEEVLRLDDGRGLPASGYYTFFGLGDVVVPITEEEIEKLKQETSLEEFEEILEELADEGKLDKVENWNDAILYTKAVEKRGDNETIDLGTLDVGNLLGSSINEDIGLTVEESLIGNTGYNMFEWTFKEKKTVRGNNWEIAIPDGFRTIESENRIFELIPENYDEDSDEDPLVHILPGEYKEEAGLSEDLWMHHPCAMEAIAEKKGLQMAQLANESIGLKSEVLGESWSDYCASILIGHTSLFAYSYQMTLFLGEATQALRVQTQHISNPQKEAMTKSIRNWLHTFVYDSKNPYAKKEADIDSEKVYKGLVKGKYKEFDHAVDRGQMECVAIVNCRMASLFFMGELGFIDDNAMDLAREVFTCGLDVRLYYTKKANDLIKKVQQENVPGSTLIHMIEKLQMWDENATDMTIDGEPLVVDEPEELKNIKLEWKSLLKQEKNKEKEKKKKAKEEKKKAEKEELEARQAEWERKVSEDEKQKSEEINSLTEKLDKDFEIETQQLKNTFEKTQKDIEDNIQKLKEKNENYKKELESLGLFKFGRKKDLTKCIEDTNEQILKNIKKLKDEENNYYNAKTNREQALKEEKKALIKQIKAKYPVTKSPKKEWEEAKAEKEKERIKKENLKKWNKLEKSQQRKKIEGWILDALKGKERMNALDIGKIVNSVAPEIIEQVTISVTLKRLVEEKRVYKTVEGRKSFFSLKSNDSLW